MYLWAAPPLSAVWSVIRLECLLDSSDTTSPADSHQVAASPDSSCQGSGRSGGSLVSTRSSHLHHPWQRHCWEVKGQKCMIINVISEMYVHVKHAASMLGCWKASTQVPITLFIMLRCPCYTLHVLTNVTNEVLPSGVYFCTTDCVSVSYRVRNDTLYWILHRIC